MEAAVTLAHSSQADRTRSPAVCAQYSLWKASSKRNGSVLYSALNQQLMHYYSRPGARKDFSNISIKMLWGNIPYCPYTAHSWCVLYDSQQSKQCHVWMEKYKDIDEWRMSWRDGFWVPLISDVLFNTMKMVTYHFNTWSLWSAHLHLCPTLERTRHDIKLV